MRLFAAVLPPAHAVDELAEAVDLRVRGLPGADGMRWTGRAGWHFTLAFMGEVDEALVPELTERLERAAHRTRAFPLRLRGGGHFGGRALWAGAAGGVAELRRLAERADAAARRTGLAMEEHRTYRPHLTLARTRTETDLRPYAAALDGFEGTPWEVGELALVRSRLPVAGVPGEQPRYETLVRCPTARPAVGGR
ncbi:RNA 2',3'-cyclic phosphodiesterase [Streptomyces sp. IB2014 016-6]|uniref:RNA 2',3'-cyclic phosphodiesterase n=1 Tax=Streptomyces sp. IB2014 016-6 TaxID=2517818 RepID=UPI0011CB2CB4|nr:RNA 2',3'-cyclic phosphodiesterase [Streptomyces sp. IB2014 016-6]TXL87300.1 RNA 2',3'-cyclic phosphodiesterase [Streptomyces sp. IB2014 016-6]